MNKRLKLVHANGVTVALSKSFDWTRGIQLMVIKV